MAMLHTLTWATRCARVQAEFAAAYAEDRPNDPKEEDGGDAR